MDTNIGKSKCDGCPETRCEKDGNCRIPVAYKCSADGKHFAEFPEKRCRYCIPIYNTPDGDAEDMANIAAARELLACGVYS